MTLRLPALLAAAALAMAPVALQAQKSIVPPAPIQLNGGPGPVIAGSFNPNKLPHKALKFLRNNYGSQHCVASEQNFGRDRYEITLSNGTEIAFDVKGTVREIEAADGQALPASVVRSLLPRKTVEHLATNGFMEQVEEIKHGKNGYVVTLTTDSPDDINYSLKGDLVSVDF